MSIFTQNGSAVIAMKGKNCVAIATDLRFGVSQITHSSNLSKAFKVNDDVFVGMAGLQTDISTLRSKIRYKVNMYKMNEKRDMKPSTMSHLIAHTLYEKRFGPYYAEPVIAGLEDGKPFISSMDIIGAEQFPDDFVVTGSMAEALLGICESFWKPDLGPDELFEVIAQCLLSGVDRDALSGWGGIVHVITPKKVISKTLKGRQD